MHLPTTIPGAPAELLERINARRARIPAGLVMMADEAGATPAEDAPEVDAPSNSEDDLEYRATAQKKVNRDLERKLNEARRQIDEFQQSIGILDDLRKALNPDGGKPDPNVDLAQQVAELRRERDEAKAEKERAALAQQIAGEVGVADIRDVALIAKQSGEDAMRALAERLKGATPAVPKPDPSAGKSGNPKPRTLTEAIDQHYIH